MMIVLSRLAAAFARVVGVLLLSTGWLSTITPAAAERLVTTISTSRVLIGSTYTGAELVLFGAIERDGRTVSRSGGYDIAISVQGPRQPVVVREKDRVGFIWVNQDQRKYPDVPGYYALITSRPIEEITSDVLQARFRLGMQQVVPITGGRAGHDGEQDEAFRAALLRLRVNAGLFSEVPRGVSFLSTNLFRTAITLPATAPLGPYEVTVHLFADGTPLASETTPFELQKVGFEATIAGAAHSRPLLYGLSAAALALACGWLASVAFRRD
jgi:uncharacterized protein (TIGR02186 family)